MKYVALWRTSRKSIAKRFLGQVLAERAVFKETISSCLIYTVLKEAGQYIFVNKPNGIKDALFLTGVTYWTLSWPTARSRKTSSCRRETGRWSRIRNFDRFFDFCQLC